jgi:hypothetical protein
MTKSSRLVVLCELLMFVVFFQGANGQNVKGETIIMTPEDRASFKFLPLQDGSRLRLIGGFAARSGMSRSLKPNDKKITFYLYVGAHNESKSEVWLQAQLRTPGNTQIGEDVIEVKPDAYHEHLFKIENLICATDYPVHLTAYLDHDRKQTAGMLDTVFHFDESCQQTVEKAQAAISDAARDGVFAFAVFSGWNEPPSAEELEHRKMDAERLAFKPPAGWKIGNAAEDKDPSIVELIRPGEEIKNWSELLTIQSFSKSRSPQHTPGEFLEGLKALREKDCPGSTKWNVIETGGNSVMYEWWSQPCGAWPEQTEIARIIYGPFTVFLLRYTKKAKELPAEERETWIKQFAEAELKGSN